MPKPNLNPKGSEQMKPKHIASLAFVAIISAGSAFAEQPDKWVRYVESTGSQYVDTGITGRWNTKIEAKVEWMELKDSAFIASRTGEWGTSNVDGKMYFCYCENANGVMFAAQDVGESIGEYYGSSYWYRRFEKNRVYTYTSEFTATNGAGKASNKVKVDNYFDVWNKSNAGYDTGLNLYIFACNQKGNASAKSNARCYGLKMWQGPKDGGDMTLVRDFHPCMKNGRAGLYDAVTGNIFYSATSTDLVCDENSEVPDEYIEYVESHGDAAYKDGLPAYVDTGIIGRSGTKVCGEFALLKSEDGCIVGSRSGNTRFYMVHDYYEKIACGYNTFHENDYQRELGKRYGVETEFNAGSQVQKVWADGVTNTVYTGSEGAVDTGYPMYLFVCNVDGNPYLNKDSSMAAKARCYGLKIWQGGTLVRDFRPCLKNGVAGLYDDVTKRIFYSSGTPLIYETKKAAPKKKEIVFVEYIESDGSNTLDTGVPARSGLRAKGEFAWTEELPTWDDATKRYLENMPNAPVFWRQQRAYLAAVRPKDDAKFYMVHEHNRYLDAAYGGGDAFNPQSSGANIIPTTNTVHSFDVTFSAGSQKIIWDGEEVASTNIAGTVDTGTSLYLFSSSYWRHRSAARCYGLEIWQDGVKVRDFKPCLYDGKGMLYDEVTQMIYRPSPDIPVSRTGKVVLSGEEKPAQYVDYVESDGTIFVDTGVIGKSGTKAELDVTFLENKDTGCLDSRSGGNRFYLFHNGSTTYGILYGYGDYFNIGTPSVGTRYHVESSLFTGSQRVWINGELKGNGSRSTAYDTNLSLYLFACHQDGAPTYPGKYRFYSLKLWQGNADGSNLGLLRNFRPVKLTNGLVVLWDFAEKKAYLPQSATAPYGYTAFPAVGPNGAEITAGTTIVIR